MSFQSILGRNRFVEVNPEDVIIPRYFQDLNLDQIMKDIFDRNKLYDLKKYYFIKPYTEDIKYRQEVLKDLENEELYKAILDFSLNMRKSREFLENINESKIPEQKCKWKLDAAYYYVNSILKLYDILGGKFVNSEGLLTFRQWLGAYIRDAAFDGFRNDTEHLMNEFDHMNFNIQIKHDHILVNQGANEEDYCGSLLQLFKKKTETEHYYQKNPFWPITLSSLEAAVLNMLKKVHPQVFVELKAYDEKYVNFFNSFISEFELEIQFYIGFCAFRKEMEEMDFHFCYPEVGGDDFTITDAYDLALARKNAAQRKPVVFNDCRFNKQERFFVITGPNQGGKTTFARAMGEIIYFGMMGLAVPAKSAAFPAFDSVFTHFATEESMETGAGKLKEELMRLKHMMADATKNSFVIINEIFTSATSYDAYIMGKRVIDYFMDKDCIGLYVTHIYELTKNDSRIGSLVASLLSEDSHIRTFKIERKEADGKGYANTIVDKYHMSYKEIKERIRR
jgi:hypothetical protein